MLADSAEFHQRWVSYPTGLAQVADFVTEAPRRGMYVFGVRRLSDAMLVGVATLCRISGEPWLTAEYGCAVGVRHRGQGYLTEATVLCARYAFGTFGLHRVEALVRPDNAPSNNMLRAAGFRPEGIARGAVRIGDTWVDHVRWAITADDGGHPVVDDGGHPVDAVTDPL